VQVAPAYVPPVQQQPAYQQSTVQQPPFQSQQFYYPVIPQQIDKNIRTITGLIDENIRAVQQTFFGPSKP